MARDLFTETQTAAARELAAQLYREWQTSQDKGTTAFFLTSAVVSMMPNKVNAEKLIEFYRGSGEDHPWRYPRLAGEYARQAILTYWVEVSGSGVCSGGAVNVSFNRESSPLIGDDPGLPN